MSVVTFGDKMSNKINPFDLANFIWLNLFGTFVMEIQEMIVFFIVHKYPLKDCGRM